jgi:hypothetical protein
LSKLLTNRAQAAAPAKLYTARHTTAVTNVLWIVSIANRAWIPISMPSKFEKTADDHRFMLFFTLMDCK